MASNEIPLELLQALSQPAAVPQPSGGNAEVPPELLAALGGTGEPRAGGEPGWLDYLKSVGGGALNRAGHVASLSVLAPEFTDASRISKALFNKTGASKALYGKDLAVSPNSPTIAALKSILTGSEPVSGYGDTLREIDMPAVDVGAVSPGLAILKQLGLVGKDKSFDSNDVAGLTADLTVNPGTGLSMLARGGGKMIGNAGNKIYKNAWRFPLAEFTGANKSKNAAINGENFLQMMKENQVGKGAYSPEELVKQYEQVVAKESQPLNEMFAANQGKQIPLAPGHNAQSLGEIQDALNTGDRATREAALERLKAGAAPEFHPMIDEMKNRLINAKGEVEGPLKNFIATASDGPLSLDQLRKYKGNQWKLARKQGGTAAGEVATDIAGGTNDLVANALENAAQGGEEAYRGANQRVATLLKPENAINREVVKQSRVAPNTALDAGMEGFALVKALAGEPKAAIELLLGLGAKKGGKALNSIHTGSRVGQRLIGTGDKLEGLASTLENARGNLWSKLGEK